VQDMEEFENHPYGREMLQSGRRNVYVDFHPRYPCLYHIHSPRNGQQETPNVNDQTRGHGQSIEVSAIPGAFLQSPPKNLNGGRTGGSRGRGRAGGLEEGINFSRQF
jgi:hypothetical protein